MTQPFAAETRLVSLAMLRGIHLAVNRDLREADNNGAGVSFRRTASSFAPRSLGMGRARTQRAVPSVRTAGPYSIRISDAADDPEWDDFLETAPGSAFKQTSCWGRVAASTGWRASRVVVSETSRVVAGVQVLMRPLPAGGSVGRVSWGPVLSEERPELTGLVFDEMLALSKANHVKYLVVHAPPRCDWLSDELEQRGFGLSPFEVDYTATACIDLQLDLDALLARMKRKARQYVRHAVDTNELTIRRGSAADLVAYNRLKDVHAARLGYERHDDSYYEGLWCSLAPSRRVELFLTEYEGELVSALLAIPFGDTYYQIERPWSGKHGDLRPNDLLEWEVIKWAKSEGYRYIDLGGINRSSAETMLSGEKGATRLTGWESFTLSLGGELMLLPECYDYAFNPILRFVYRRIPSSAMVWFADLLRRRAWGTGAT